MDTAMIKRKRRRLTIVMAAVGFSIAVIIWAYSELAASAPQPVSFALAAAVVATCPPSLLTVPLIDAEPGTIDFAITWLMVALLNSALYGVIGIMIGRLRWEADS